MAEEHLWRLFDSDQQRISALDTATLTIKGWALSVATAAAGVGITRDDGRVVALGLASTVLFWFIDHGYRSVQLMHAERATRISDLLEPSFPLVSTRPQAASTSTIHKGPVLRYWSTFVFYGALSAGLVALTLYL